MSYQGGTSTNRECVVLLCFVLAIHTHEVNHAVFVHGLWTHTSIHLTIQYMLYFEIQSSNDACYCRCDTHTYNYNITSADTCYSVMSYQSDTSLNRECAVLLCFVLVIYTHKANHTVFVQYIDAHFNSSQHIFRNTEFKCHGMMLDIVGVMSFH